MEIERKYLVESLPENLEGFPHVEIEQGYLCTSPTLRIRRMGNAFILTVKEKIHSKFTTSIVNREEEFNLSEEAYLSLKAKCEGRMVLKTRYRIPLLNTMPDAPALTAELDIFHGVHQGLMLVEVEFPSEEMANSFVAPQWCGPDVSNDKRYRTSWLAFNNI